MFRITCLLFGILFFVATGCASTRQIETASPKPRTIPGVSGGEVSGLGLLAIDIETGETSLPDEIQALRFRIEEIRLHSDEGEWTTFPADLNSFEILPDRYLGKTILSTRVQPVLYDSVSIKISDAFVLFGENAGGPLTLPKDTPLKIAIEMQPKVGEATQVKISIEPGASLFKDSNCRWYFVPFWNAELE
ncbi:MAG: hypothetical protein AB8G77_13385 [Rhodothermales bacterium]